MAVFKRLQCTSCGSRTQVAKEERRPPACEKCGGVTRYSVKWYGSLWMSTSAGKRKQVVRALSTKKGDAVVELGRLNSERADGLVVPDEEITLSQACDRFLEWCAFRVKQGQMAPLTETYYRRRVEKYIRPQWGRMKLRDFAARAEDLAEQHKERRIDQVKPATVNRELKCLRRLMEFCRKKKFIRTNPVVDVEYLAENNQRDRVLTPEEKERLLLQTSGKCRMAVIIALNTGLRRDGVLTLKWSEVDWMRSEIIKVVKHHRRQGPKVVRIPLTIALRNELLSWKEAQKVVSIDGYVLPSPKNPSKPMLGTSDFGFQSACKRAGISDFTFHDLRHQFATEFLRKTKNLHALAEILGHSPAEEYRMSRRYAHILSDEKREAMKAFEGDS